MDVDEVRQVGRRLQRETGSMAGVARERVVDFVVADQAVRHPRQVNRRVDRYRIL